MRGFASTIFTYITSKEQVMILGLKLGRPAAFKRFDFAHCSRQGQGCGVQVAQIERCFTTVLDTRNVLNDTGFIIELNGGDKTHAAMSVFTNKSDRLCVLIYFG